MLRHPTGNALPDGNKDRPDQMFLFAAGRFEVKVSPVVIQEEDGRSRRPCQGLGHPADFPQQLIQIAGRGHPPSHIEKLFNGGRFGGGS